LEPLIVDGVAEQDEFVPLRDEVCSMTLKNSDWTG
jgi:hypothetical protein